MKKLDRIDKALRSKDDFDKFLKKDALKCVHHLKFEATRIFENVYWNGAVKKEIFSNVTIRSLKVYYTYYPRVFGFPSGFCHTSRIILQGNWLRNKGFEIGSHIRVIALNGLIIIVPDQHNLFQRIYK